MNKETAIYNAWMELIDAELFNEHKDIIDENGWVQNCLPNAKFVATIIKRNGRCADLFDSKSNENWETFIRPLTLKDLETNNGWTKIETAEDLPTDISETYECYDINGNVTERKIYDIDGVFEWGEYNSERLTQSDITHFRVKIKHPKPHY